jgi:methylglutamate dehydrogenase subunit D
VSNAKLSARSALDIAKSASRSLVSLDVLDDMSVVWIAARKGQTVELIRRISELHGVTLPSNPRLVKSRSGFDFIGAGPDQWLAIAPATAAGLDLAHVLAGQLQGLASVADQTDARTLVRVSGEKARDTLAKGLPIDLHPRVFPEGAVAITHADHIGVIVWRPDESDAFVLACSRSYSDSFWRWLTESAAEHGLAVF